MTGNLGAAWVHIGPASLIDRVRGVLCCVCELRLSLRRLMLCPVAAPRLVRGRVRVRVRVRLRVRARARARVRARVS